MQRTPTCENCLRNYELRECLPVGNRIPLLLPCGHTFCEGCILKATKTKTEVSCFKCDAKVQCDGKGEAGVKTLLPNIYLLGLLLYNRRIASDKITGGTVSAFNGVGNVIHNSNSSLSATVEPSESETAATCEDKSLCEECNEKAPSCQCDKCGNIKFCDSCFEQVHKTSKLLMKHNPSPIELLSNENQLKCDQHDRKLEFYDKDASAAVCAICIISERCRGHDVVLLSEMNDDTPSKIDDAVKNAKETLFWWQNSSKILTKILPDEYMEANALFDDIQSKFNAFHTILQKRQLELMLEASEKLLVNGGGVHEQLSDLSHKIGSLSTVLSDVEMIVQDKNLMNLKSNEILKKLEEYDDAPCIISQKSVSKENCFKFHLEDEALNSLECLGEVKSRSNDLFTFQKKSDVSDELKDELKSGAVTICDIGEEEILSGGLCVVGSNNVTSKFSLLSNCNVLVCVTDVTSPVEFKVQKVSDKDRLQVLMTELNKYCRYANSSDNLLHTVEDGQLVCAQFLSDNNWYRARVTNKWCPERPDVLPSWSNGLSVEVVYIDYGNVEYLPLTRLRNIPKKFLEVPEMAVTCCLTDIEPPPNNDEWPERSKKAFASLTGDRPMMMIISKRVGCKLYVDLRKPDDDEPTRDDDRPASVKDALVFLEVASFKSIDSSPKDDMHQLMRKYKPYEHFSKGEFVDTVVTHIDHPEAIFIQKLDSPIHDEQTRLGLVYSNSRNKKGWMIDYPYRNLVCAAKFSADKAWYRAEVLRVDNDDTVEVEYVDYGNREKLPFSDLRKIPDMYLEMPKQCVKVKLHGMKLQEGEEDYSKQSKEFLHKFFLGKPLVTFIKEFDDDIPVVVLYDTSTDADVNMNELLQRFIMKWKQPDPTEDVVVHELENMISSVAACENLSEEKGSHEGTFSFPTYLPPDIPNCDRFTATGVHIDDKANIFLAVTNSEDSCVSDIMQQLNCDGGKLKKCPLESTATLHPKQAVLGKFLEDNLWYRAEIVCIINDIKVKVRFIDFGNVEVTDVSNICLEPAFLNIPCQCICVCLSGVEPLDGEWSANAIELLREYIVSEVVGVEMKIKNKTKILSALIYVDEGPTINHMLVSEGLAALSGKLESKPQMPFSKKEPSKINSTYLWFTEQKLPKHGLKFDVMVTQVNQPDIIYIQRLPVDNDGLFCGDLNEDETVQEAYDNLMLLESFSEIINREGYFNGHHLKLKPVVGMACVCMYTSDGLHYRARIEHIDEEKGVAEVVYVDYGTSEIVSIDSLLPLPSELIKLPMQAFKVCIAGIKPAEQINDKPVEMLRDTNWTLESMKTFFNFVANKRLIAEIIHTDSDMPTIHLYERTMKDGVAELIYIGGKMKGCNLADFDI